MVIYSYDKAGNFWHLTILIKLCITDGWVLYCGPRVCSVLLTAEPYATYKNSWVHSELWAGAIVNTADWNLCWCKSSSLLQPTHLCLVTAAETEHWDLHIGGEKKGGKLEHRLSGVKALVITNRLPGLWVALTTSKPRVMTCVILHGLLFVIDW